MNETFCTDVSDCSAFECDSFLCWDGLNLRPNISQELSVVLYAILRILERVVFALLHQVDRELLQLSKEERKAKSTCCFTFEYKGSRIYPRTRRKLPAGIYKQAWLRFLGTFLGVLSFVLILERNIWMFVLLIIIDSFGVGIISLYQHKDAPTTHAELMKIDIPKDIISRDVDQEWLGNMRKFLGKPKQPTETQQPKEKPIERALQQPLLKFF